MRTRSIATLATVLLLHGCATTHVADHVEAPRPASPEVSAKSSEALPAGVYFHDDVYLRHACSECARPAVALVAGIFEDDASASAALENAPSLAPGYPWAVDADALTLADDDARGTVVVLGLFATAEHAQQENPGEATVVALASGDEASRRRSAWRMNNPETRRGQRLVVQVDTMAGGRAPAYGAEQLTDVLSIVSDTPFEDFDHFTRVITTRTATHEPICAVASGSVHTRKTRDALWSFHPLFTPVRCEDGTDAWVRKEHTRLDTVVARSEGEARLIQVVLVECDTPTFKEWRYGAQGRAPLGEAEPTAIASNGGCGEP